MGIKFTNNGNVSVIQDDAAELNATVQGSGNFNVVQSDATLLNGQTKSIGSEIRADFSAAPVNITLSTSSARSSQLATGYYEITSTADCFFLQGDSSVVALTTSHILHAFTYRLFYVDDTTNKGYIAAIVSSGDGTVCISKLGV